ncbi:MAG TPA: biotin carboxylase N-terminal domain-containing protein, partial [Candidatus Limnocylindrales bacterium]|nr:biotin carboxylase N-terminal domain-containing protein [Candidatus Limnocylindrales bacterium]
MFSSVLVANRGEIALRVMRTCARLGIRTVAVYSDADARSPHVRAADAAVRLGPGPAAESYLRGDLVIEAALATGAEAIHPGYGFLAENASFAEAVLAAGLAWVGPPPAAMRALGDKSRAKALAIANDVPVLPGFHDEGATDDALAAAAPGVGFPLLVKASAGGGGRGMRLVRDPGELPSAVAAARREAQAAFGDDRLLLERYVERPRHVEIQLLGDEAGTLVHLGERECSIQRRHQKLVEESPSPALTPAIRAAMGEAALRLARAAGYANAGTCEFLLDERGAFFFLEVNARLQVEHPVTEAVTGLDLVEQQLRVAAGEPLGFGQGDVRLDGHAIEVRVVAEDAAAGFLPAIGRITAFAIPDGVRVDTGVEAGTVVSPFYDSLVAKVIAHGPDRGTAIDRLADALDELRLDGVASNLDLLAAVLAEPAFRAGDLHTGFLEEHRLVEGLRAVPPEAIAAAAAVRSLPPVRPATDASEPAMATPWAAGRPWRLAGVGEPSWWLAGGSRVRAAVDVDGAEGVARVARIAVGDAAFVVRRTDDGTGDATLRLGDRVVGVRPSTGRRLVDTVRVDGRAHRVRPAPPPSREARVDVALAGGAIAAPMPGRIVRIHVGPGELVEATQPLLVLEAMKMEH